MQESSLGTFHPLVAKTYYWIGFIYKHSLPSPSSSKSSSTSLQVEIAYLLLALQAFTKSARIRLSLPEKTTTTNTNAAAITHDKAIQEAKQAIQWVLRALQERHKKHAGSNSDPEFDGDSKNDDTKTSISSWKQQQSFKRLILHSRTSNSSSSSPPRKKNSNSSSGCMYLDALEESIRLEVQGDQNLRKHNNRNDGKGSNSDGPTPMTDGPRERVG